MFLTHGQKLWVKKLNVWAWNKRWRNRKDGTGYAEDE